MKRNRFKGLEGLLFQNMGILGTVLFVFLLGLSIGVFTELLLSASDRQIMSNFLNLYVMTDWEASDLPYFLLHSILQNLGLLLIMILAGISVIGFPAILLALIYKGAALGFSSGLLIESLGGKGVLAILFTLAPQNLILLPALFLAAIASLSLAFSLLAAGPNEMKKSLASCAGNFGISYLIIGSFLLTGCVVEGIIVPFFQLLLR